MAETGNESPQTRRRREQLSEQPNSVDDFAVNDLLSRAMRTGAYDPPPPQPTAVGGENDGVQLERIPSLVRGDSALEPLDPSRVPPPAMPR